MAIKVAMIGAGAVGWTRRLMRDWLAAHSRAGTRVKLIETEGAARLHTKTVAEMSQYKQAARTNAAASDKGKMTRTSRSV